MTPLAAVLAGAPRRTDRERADVDRLEALVVAAGGWDEVWSRSTPLHVTGSAFVVHPPTARVLLRWHERQQAWLHVGGHGDPGEEHPLDVARREAAEETGLDDLRPWPDARLVHVAIVPVPANDREPAHEHADLRYVLATDEPDRAEAEHDGAEVRWLSIDDARALASRPNVQESLRRVGELLGARGRS